jgi:hypothetical protein
MTSERITRSRPIESVQVRSKTRHGKEELFGLCQQYDGRVHGPRQQGPDAIDVGFVHVRVKDPLRHNQRSNVSAEPVSGIYPAIFRLAGIQDAAQTAHTSFAISRGMAYYPTPSALFRPIGPDFQIWLRIGHERNHPVLDNHVTDASVGGILLS